MPPWCLDLHVCHGTVPAGSFAMASVGKEAKTRFLGKPAASARQTSAEHGRGSGTQVFRPAFDRRERRYMAFGLGRPAPGRAHRALEAGRPAVSSPRSTAGSTGLNSPRLRSGRHAPGGSANNRRHGRRGESSERRDARRPPHGSPNRSPRHPASRRGAALTLRCRRWCRGCGARLEWRGGTKHFSVPAGPAGRRGLAPVVGSCGISSSAVFSVQRTRTGTALGDSSPGSPAWWTRPPADRSRRRR